MYPIHGVTEDIDPTAKSAVLECQARSRVEERLEVTLTGVAPSAAGQTRSIKARAVTPKGGEPAVPAGVVVAEGEWRNLLKLRGIKLSFLRIVLSLLSDRKSYPCYSYSMIVTQPLPPSS